MKKTLLIAAISAAISSSVFAQGFVFFSAGTSAATRMSTNSVVNGASTGLTGTASGLYYYALFASSSQTSVNGQTTAVSGTSSSYVFNNQAGWTLVGIGTNNANAGRLQASSQGNTSGGQGALNADNSLTIQGTAGGVNTRFVTVGWLSTSANGNIGTSLAALTSWYNGGALGGWIGQSAVGTGFAIGDGALVSPQSPFGTGSGQVGGFLLGLTPVPEPATMALAGLGGLAMLALRRKK